MSDPFSSVDSTCICCFGIFPLFSNASAILSISSILSISALPYVNVPDIAFAVKSASFAFATACNVKLSVKSSIAAFALISSIVNVLIPEESNLRSSLNDFFCHPNISSIEVTPLNLDPDSSPTLLNKLPKSLNCCNVIFHNNIGFI